MNIPPALSLSTKMLHLLYSKASFARFADLFPRHCLLCAESYTEGTPYCRSCLDDLPWLLPQAFCCDEHAPIKIASDALFRYAFPINVLISRFKYHQQLTAGKSLCNVLRWACEQGLLDHCISAKPSLILPVPISRKKQQKRGFNQAAVFADLVATHFDLPLASTDFVSKRDTRAQAGLSKSEREKNLKHAFKVHPSYIDTLCEQHILLFDDVCTTGTTLEEVESTLSNAGCVEISRFCLASTPL